MLDLRYSYDGVGNILNLRDKTGGGDVLQTFTYDDLDRLETASGAYSANYSYDAIGNLLRKDGLDYEYDAVHPHAVQYRKLNGVVQESYAYDANGNLTARAGDSLTYDAESRLRSVTTAGETITFTYDGDGRRVLRDTITDTIAYVGPHYELRFNKTNKPEDLDGDCRVTVVDIMRVAVRWGNASGPEDVNGDGTVDVADVQQVAGQWRQTCHVLAEVVKYYSLGGRRVAMRRNNTLYYLLGDHLGSTSVAYNTTTGQAQTMRYYPWGGVRSGDVPTDRRFTGQRWDATIGLYDYNARWYEPALGRFVQPDTIVPEPGNPQALNRYAYVYNNPLKHADPTGHCPQCLFYALWEAFFGHGVSGAGGDLYDPATGQSCGDTGCVTPHKSEAQVAAGVALDVAVAETAGRAVGAVARKGAGALRTALRGGDEAGTVLKGTTESTTLAQHYGKELPPEARISFSGWQATKAELESGSKLYRIHTPVEQGGNPYSTWWMSESPASEIQFRIDQAVKPEWNTAGQMSILTVPQGETLTVWVGKAAYVDNFYIGGGSQVYAEVPRHWIITGPVPW